MSHIPVLIIGAGPTGLMMACELERHDIPFRIIDKKSERTEGSNATWIQTRTLEIFDLIGMADRFLKIGHQCDAINFYAKGKQLTTIPLTQIDSSYPFILMLPQRDTERLLNKKLEESKIQVERSLELIDIKQTSDGVVSTIQLPNGETESVTSDWVIACDGATSTVREKCQIPFLGEEFPEQFMVADAKMSSFLPTNQIHVFFDKGTIFPDKSTLFSAFPWGSNEYRLSANLYQEKPRKNFTELEIREVVAERTYGNYIVNSVSWISPFWIRAKMVDQMRHGSIFLAGDAAHIHSPVGGQGMNTGIQDAFNLAWKLALVIKGKAKPVLLDSYQTERFPVIKNVVTQTDFFTKMMIFDKFFLSKLKKFSHQISDNPALLKEVSEELTQINIEYTNSVVIDDQLKPDEASPQPGERAPDVIIPDSKKLYHYFYNTLHNILLFTGDMPKEDELIKIKELQKLLNQKFSDFVQAFIITSKNLRDVDHIIFDKNDVVHHRYHVKKPAIYIVRPDNYIAYFSNKIDFLLVEKFLQQYLKMNG